MKPELSSEYCLLCSDCERRHAERFVPCFFVFFYAKLNDLLRFEIGKGTITITFIVVAATAGRQKPFRQQRTEIMAG